jgi:hypothetical protein
MSARILYAQFRGAVARVLAVITLFGITTSTASAQATSLQYKGLEGAATARRGLLPPVQPVVPLLGGRRDTTTDLRRALGGSGTAATAAAAKKVAQEVAEWKRSIDYSGPRFGITYLPKAAVDSLANHNIDVNSAISQFGWQIEREIHVSPEGPRVLNEWVFLAGGLESGVFLPSATWLIGVRDRSGTEFGVGPNVSVAGVALAAAAGITVHSGGLHFPMNVAVASSKGGARVSFLTGFTLR